MRRKLIQLEAFEQIVSNSVSNAERELREAADVLSRALGKEQLSLHSFTNSTVMYETLDETYVHASYDLKDNHVTFQNVQELVVDHDSKKQKRKAFLAEMVDAVLNDNQPKADKAFGEYMNNYSFNEAKKVIVRAKGDVKDNEFETVEKDEKKKPKGKLKGKLPFFAKQKAEKTREKHEEEKKGGRGKNNELAKDAFKKRLKSAGKKVEEAYTNAANVLDYVEYVKFGPTLAETLVRRDETGNIVDLRMPNINSRNEAKILSFDWKTLNHKVKVLREQALSLHLDENFIKAMLELKSENALSNAHGMDTVVGNIVRAWPQVLYATQPELTMIVGEAFSVAGVENYDDETCNFLAEGVLRKAHEAYQERVSELMHLASAPVKEQDQDDYEHFQSVMENFFPYVDQKFELERKVFEDLYVSLEGLYHTADRRGDDTLKDTCANYLNELADILNEKARPDIELAEEVAGWLVDLIETNLETQGWNVSNKPHISVNGEHPAMADKAKKGYSPSADFSGDWGDALPMIGQDNMTYKGGKFSKEARGHSWGNIGGKDTFPSLDNPNVPKPFGDYTLKGEPGADKNTFGQHWSSWQSGDTWPRLQNPNVPNAVTPKTYKMNHGKEKDLVVDK